MRAVRSSRPPRGPKPPVTSKGRLALFHWNAKEAAGLARALRADGWKVDVESEDGARGGRAVLAFPPDAVVIYLARLPSHGRETAHWLRSSKAGRNIPILFVDGTPEAVENTRAKVTGAVFTTAGRLATALRKYAKAKA
jgi:DNA-binding response OmpR family regulator